MIRLKEFICIDCALKSIGNIRGLSALQHLDASNNKLDSFDSTLDVILDLPKLSKLVLIGNPICSDENYFPRVIEATLRHHLSSLDYRRIDDATYIAIELAIGRITDAAMEDMGKSASSKIEAHYKIKLDALKSVDRLNRGGHSSVVAHDSVVAAMMTETLVDTEKNLNSLVEYIRNIEVVQAAHKADNMRLDPSAPSIHTNLSRPVVEEDVVAESLADSARLSLPLPVDVEAEDQRAELPLEYPSSLSGEESEDMRHSTLIIPDNKIITS